MKQLYAIAYYRVSTAKQGASGLGLEGQRQAVAQYMMNGNWRVALQFTEVESGRRDERPQLDAALLAARLRRLPIIVAKVDRLTRSVAFLSRLLESGVDVRFADLPALEGPTGRFMLQQMAAVAELEAGLISSRTKSALAAARLRGVRLGGDRGGKLTAAARAAGNSARALKAARRADDLLPCLLELQASGIDSASGLARELSKRGISTATGRGTWSAGQVLRVLATSNMCRTLS